MKTKAFNIALICALVSAIMVSMISFEASCEEMYDNIIRIRILANSNAKADQELKLQIRNDILEFSKDMFSGVNSYEDAVIITNENSQELLGVARNTIRENGYDYTVSLEFKDEFFDTRVYDNFTLPAGIYKTAVFTVGEGKGQNWWCVIFPQVCVGACSGNLEDSISKASSDYAYNAEDYVIKFKTVEILEKVKKYLFL